MNDPKPLVLLIDEIDELVGDTLIPVLRQLHAGGANRPAAFPQSVILYGIRDVCDLPHPLGADDSAARSRGKTTGVS